MDILFIIGNGFDINLGLKSSYNDFYKYYGGIHSKTDKIKELKKAISNNITDWADLEMALGMYTKHITTTQEFDEIFEDIVENLAEYLKQEESKLDFSKANSEKFYQYLENPDIYLPIADYGELSGTKSRLGGSQNLNIISLNYTRTVEKVLFKGSLKFGLPRRITVNNGNELYLRSIQHIHGYFEDRMILGVNDLSQIENPNFHNNKDVLDVLVKPFCNQASKELIDDGFRNQIKKANFIYIFGSSISNTDKIWWELIGNRLKADCRLIIFRKPEHKSQIFRYKASRVERETKELFLSKTTLSDDEKVSVSDKIFVGANSNFFSGLLD